MINDIVAGQLGKISVLLELEGKDWESKAFRDAKSTVKRLERPVSSLYEDRGHDGLKALDDIGSGIASVIADYLEHGSMAKLDNLCERYPDDVFDITKIRGVGPTTTRKLLDNLSVETVEDLKQAAENEEVRRISGLGPSTEQKIIDGVETLQSKEEAVLLSEADRITNVIQRVLTGHDSVNEVDVAGAQRRRCETVSELIVVIATESPRAVHSLVRRHEFIRDALDKDENSVTYAFAKGDVSITVRTVAPSQFGSALFSLTGPEDHVEEVHESGGSGDFEDEKDLYEAASLPFIPPELRDSGEDTHKVNPEQSVDIVDKDDVRGDLHVHTNWSDGRGSVRDMVDAAEQQGYEYIALTDHSKSSGFAGGLSSDELARKNEVIETVNDETDLDVLKGSEVDILNDGSLDYDDTVLRQLDVVVASVHSQFDMDEAAMTHRVCQAVKHPLVDILGHMTGRLLLEREGYDIDVGAVLQAAADHETAVEINSTPRRLDVSADTARRAKHLGVRVVINTDSHSPRSLPSVRYGVDQARRAGLQASDILNTKPIQDWPENMSF